MWSDLMGSTRPSHANPVGRSLAASIVCWVAVTTHTQVHAADSDLPILCNVKTAPNTAAPVEAIDNCVEFGAAVGELGVDWRQKLPDNVRWLTRKDASALCSQTHTELGQKVGPPMDQGCVFLSPKVCTIVTVSYISHAMLGNAVRNCAP